MNRREKLHAARAAIMRDVRDSLRTLSLASDADVAAHVSAIARRAFDRGCAYGYEAAEPDVCARCGAEIAAADEEIGR